MSLRCFLEGTRSAMVSSRRIDWGEVGITLEACSRAITSMG